MFASDFTKNTRKKKYKKTKINGTMANKIKFSSKISN